MLCVVVFVLSFIPMMCRDFIMSMSRLMCVIITCSIYSNKRDVIITKENFEVSPRPQECFKALMSTARSSSDPRYSHKRAVAQLKQDSKYSLALMSLQVKSYS